MRPHPPFVSCPPALREREKHRPRRRFAKFLPRSRSCACRPTGRRHPSDLRPTAHRGRIQMTYSAMTARPASVDLMPAARTALALAGGSLLLLVLYAAGRAAFGLAPATPWVRDAALAVHLATVIPALPLGLYVFLARKGGARHKALGKLWLLLMAVTAVATLFIRNVGEGGFSFIHLFSVLTLIGIPKVVTTARRGDIAAHRAHLLRLFVGAMLVAGSLSFLPGRTMALWAFG
ncbi:MAG: hypothetical protein C0489_11460 [Candidatus Accumulibacter sp.]|nr:hypothetical protein [Accumulibacter sp.]